MVGLLCNMGLIMKISKRKEPKAYHEASHVVIALRLGLKYVRAYITDKEPDHGGRTVYFTPYRDSDPEIEDYEHPEDFKKKTEDEITACLAGAIGQRKFNPKGFRKHHAESDWSEAAILAPVALETEIEQHLSAALDLSDDDVSSILERVRQSALKLAKQKNAETYCTYA